MASIVVVCVPFRHLANFRVAAEDFAVRIEPISAWDNEDEQDGTIRYYLNPFPKDKNEYKGQTGYEYYAFLSFLGSLESEGILVNELANTPETRASYEACVGEDALKELEGI